MGCKTPKTFNSQVFIIGEFEYNWPEEIIKNEPMLFNCDMDYAHWHGGPITKAFINALPHGWDDAVFDSRVHMLMPGWYPAIPGWHHDDVPRSPIPAGQHFITAGQPDYDTPRYKAEHLMGLVNAEVCPTAFVIGECNMPAIPDGELIYRKWNNVIDEIIEAGDVEVYTAESGKIIQFDWETFHTGRKSEKTGWRWFARVSRNTDRQNQITNEIRRQVQVYLEFPMEGW